MRISDWSSDVCSSDLVQNVAAVGQRQRRAHVLFDDDDGVAFVGQLAAHLHKVANDQGRQAFERLVEPAYISVANHSPDAGQHLMLAARYLLAPSARALLQATTGFSARLDRLRALAPYWRQHSIIVSLAEHAIVSFR